MGGKGLPGEVIPSSSSDPQICLSCPSSWGSLALYDLGSSLDDSQNFSDVDRVLLETQISSSDDVHVRITAALSSLPSLHPLEAPVSVS